MYRGLPSASRENLPIASQVAASVLCLPIYPDLSIDQVQRIIGILENP
jgi:dTDP-4-amino-4,6-dideoxygalactose transaminase